MDNIIRWVSPGPVTDAFMRCRAPLHGMRGPVGSGKTRSALTKMILLAVEQASNGAGVRPFRFLTVRNTYRELHRTTLQTWGSVLPGRLGKASGGMDQPVMHVVELGHPDGVTVVRLEAWFIALGDGDPEHVLRGMEFTAAYLDEADLLHPGVLDYLMSRGVRYPGVPEGVLPTWGGIIATYNAPVLGNYMLELEEDPPFGSEFFVQPGGLSPGAENLVNLPSGYYERQRSFFEKRNPHLLARMVHNRPGISRDGLPVYEEFCDEIHVSRVRLDRLAGVELHIGCDGGRTPCAVICQYFGGQLRVIDEIIFENAGPKRLGSAVRRRVHELGGGKVTLWPDPACFHGGDDEDKAFAAILREASGFSVRMPPVPSNALHVRREAVRTLLRDFDGRPSLFVSPACKVLRAGLNGGFSYRRRRGSVGEFHDQVEKNKYSHPCEALEYVALSVTDYAGGEIRRRVGDRLRRPVQAEHDFMVFSA